MSFSRSRYKKSLNEKFMKNPGKKNREHRKEVLNSTRGERVPSSRVVREKRGKVIRKRMEREIREGRF